MNLPKIQYGSSEKSRVIDGEGTTLTTTTKFHKGNGVATNRLTIRKSIPTSRPSIEELGEMVKDLFYDPDKINPSITIESRVSAQATSYFLLLSYTVLEME